MTRHARRRMPATPVEALEARRLLYDFTFTATNNAESVFAQMQGGNLVVGIDGGQGISISNPAGATVLINALGGNDQVHVVSNGGAIITVDAGAGDDIIQLGGGGSGQNLSNLPGNSFLGGGLGFDTVLAQDGNNPSASTYTITDSRFDRPGWGGFYYQADIERLTLYTTQLGDTVNVHSTWPSQPVRIYNRGGADNVFVGNSSQGVQGIRAHVFIEGAGTNTIYISNAADTIARSANIDWDVSSSWGALNNLAPFPIIWQNAVTTQVTITTGTASDSILVNRNNSPLVLNSAGGNDTVQIGNPLVNGLALIQASVQIENNPAFTNLVITNQGDVLNRTWTIDIANGYGSLVGMAPAPIYWDNADIASISLTCGNGSDTGWIKRLSETLSINNSSGSTNLDTITIGHNESFSGIGLREITGGGITIDNDPWYTNLIIDDGQNWTVARTATLDFVNGFNVLSGLAPAVIRYDDNDTRDVLIRTGNHSDMLNVLRTATSSGTTTIASWGGIDTLTIGNPITGLQSITGTNILLTNQGFGFNLTLDNRADTIARDVTQTWLGDNTIFNGLFGGTFGYYGWAPPYPNLLMGSGADTLTISDAYGRIRIDTGAGNDSITLGGPAAQWCDVQLLDPVVELASLSIEQAGLVELVGPTNQVLVTASLSLSGDGRLDIGDRAVIVDYSGASPIESIRAGITSGYNGGAWNGTGIRSSVAATTPGTAVGFAEATDLHTTFPASFAGQNVDDTTILLRHTLTGDANLDRNANLSDFNRLAANFGQASRRWSTGDFNYDTAANLTDFNLLAGRFGASLSPDGPASPPVEDPRDGLRDLLG